MSPSPHGRVGTLSHDPCVSRVPVTVPSWSGRNLPIDCVLAQPSSVTVPSWSGRNYPEGQATEQVETGHRPLMVGSERNYTGGRFSPAPKSPSPHGRVGTSRCPKSVGTAAVTVPSWSGRNSAFTNFCATSKKVTVPSWSGRNLAKRVGREMMRRVTVPSWSGRNQCFMFFTQESKRVTVPSWSGRNIETRTVYVRVDLSHRPLMVGSEPLGAE